MEFRKNYVIDYYDNRRIACGLILEVDDRRLRVLTDLGKETNIPLSRALSSGADPLFPFGGARDTQVSRLKEICAQREAIKHTINLAELWEVVVGETAEIDIEELAELFFGKTRDANRLASLLRAINDDRLFFKIRPDSIEVPSPDRVEQALQQRAKEEERRNFIAQSADFLVGLKNGNGLRAEDAPKGLARLLEEAVKVGPDWVGSKGVKEIFTRAGLAQGWNPFRVLVKLGIWSEDENITLRTENVPVEFPPEVLARVEEVAKNPPSGSAEDLAHLEIITIDSMYTKDVDDALSLTYDGNDVVIGIHITDVTHFIGNDPVLHRELLDRSTSLYLPETTIPMLPPALSEDAASLSVGEIRPALSLMVRIGAEQKVQEYRIVPSVIRVSERLSYEEADERIRLGASREAGLFRAALALRARRVASGALIFKDPELAVRVTREQGITVRIRERETPSQILVSEMMILANSLFARYLYEHQIPGLFRSQPPALEKVELGDGYDPVLSYRAKKALSRGDLSTRPAPHATLGLDLYTTATSPLRRYPDLLVQGQIKAAIEGKTPPLDATEVDTLISEISYRLDRASAMERERQRYFLLKYLEHKRDEEFEAVVLHRFPRFHLVQIASLCLNAALMAPNSLSLNPYDKAVVRLDKINPREDRLTVALVRLL
jgi:exoribonuclease II